LAAALAESRALGMGGLNLTVPLKEAALPLVDTLTPEAERIGAVNTIILGPKGTLIGDNTDGRGFLQAVRSRTRVRGGPPVIIGAGGFPQAVAVAPHRGGCGRLVIANRTPARAEALAERLARLGTTDLAVVPLSMLARDEVLADASLVVNTTPLGLAGARLRVRYAAAPRGCLFVDLVYGTRPTPFLAGAARARHATLDGGAMLLHQGALAFEAWTGRRAPRAAMARALRAHGLTLTQLAPAATSNRRRPPLP